MRLHYRWFMVAASLLLVLALPLAVLAGDSPAPSRQGGTVALALDAIPASTAAQGAVPVAGPETAVPLVVDDGVLENSIGLNSTSSATQFLWFNRFTPNAADYPFDLTQIWVMFEATANSNVNVGDAIELDVYTDADGDPNTGATFMASFNVTVQAADGTTWSVYQLTPPVTLTGPSGDVLIGAVDRAVESGVTAPTWPAALDTTATQARSWVASYSETDPPAPPTIPSNGLFGTIDSFGFPGNWLVRGYGVKAPSAVSVTSFGTASAALPLALVLVPAAVAVVAFALRKRAVR